MRRRYVVLFAEHATDDVRRWPFAVSLARAQELCATRFVGYAHASFYVEGSR